VTLQTLRGAIYLVASFGEAPLLSLKYLKLLFVVVSRSGVSPSSLPPIIRNLYRIEKIKEENKDVDR